MVTIGGRKREHVEEIDKGGGFDHHPHKGVVSNRQFKGVYENSGTE